MLTTVSPPSLPLPHGSSVGSAGPWLAEALLLVAWAREAGAAQGASAGDIWSRPPPDGWLPPPAAGTSDAAAATVAAELCRLVLSYIRRFQCKQCCFSDIKPFLSLLAAGRGAAAAADAIRAFQADIRVWIEDADTALAALVAERAGAPWSAWKCVSSMEGP